MRIVFMGSAGFAVPTLFALSASGHEVPLVVTQPDRKAGRGGNIRKTPVAEAAGKDGIEVLQPENMKSESFRAHLEAIKADLCVIIAYGLKIPADVLGIPKHGFINAHASILPKYRGAAPVPYAILNGEKETGVTIFKLEEEWDTGPVYGYIKTPIRNNDTAESVLERMSVMAAEKMIEVVDEIENDSIEPIEQNHAEATSAPKLKRNNGRIDWSRSAEEIDCQIRAFQPWPEAFTEIPGKKGKKLRLNILAVEEEKERVISENENVPGRVIQADPKYGVVVAVGNGKLLRLTKIKPEGKRPMTGAEYVRGSRLEEGFVLGAE
ncbi:MAG: methionyl-tRNA formyltransferase [Planctomycetota bacterium]